MAKSEPTAIRNISDQESPLIFFGAGASAAFGYPTTRLFVDDLKKQIPEDTPQGNLLRSVLDTEGVRDWRVALLRHDCYLTNTATNLREIHKAARKIRENVTPVPRTLASRENLLIGLMRKHEHLNIWIMGATIRYLETSLSVVCRAINEAKLGLKE